jgi:hypothetical protein
MMRRMIDFSKWGPATVLVVVIAAVVALAGGLVTLVHPESLSFSTYLQTLVAAAGAAGLLGIGRGVHALSPARPEPSGVHVPDPRLDDPEWRPGGGTGAVPRETHVNLGDE